MSTNDPTIHFLGVGGVGVSAVARYYLEQGYHISGCDRQENPLTADIRSHGGEVVIGHSADHITPLISQLIYTDDIPADHPERLAAAARNIPQINFSQALGEIMNQYPYRVAIAGTNGKSTTAALTGLLLAGAGLDPTVFVGSRVPEFSGNYRSGKGGIVVAEADEYRNHFHQLRPTSLTITNIEWDHVDFFPDLESIRQSFMILADHVPPSGHFIINADDPSLLELFGSRPGRVTFGWAGGADLQIIGRQFVAGGQIISYQWHGQKMPEVQISIPGEFNVLNVAAAMATCLTAGAPPTTFPKTLAGWRGIWRRFEIIAREPVTVINDYAHHPTALRATIGAAREFYPGRKLIAVFQAHHQERFDALFQEFSMAFTDADLSLVLSPYRVPGRDGGQAGKHTAGELVALLKQRGHGAMMADTLDAATHFLRQQVKPGDVILLIGAGDIWRIAEPLASYYASHYA